MATTVIRIFLGAAVWLFGTCVANAATISVVPGPGTPVQDAIDAAQPGDTVRLAGGPYPEMVVVTKPLTLTGPPTTYLDDDPAAAVIVPGCGAAQTAITVAADGVKIRDLRVVSFSHVGIDVQGRDRVQLQRVLVHTDCPGALYGVSVVASTRVKINRCWIDATVGFPSVALHLGGIAERGGVRVTASVTARHTYGMLIESCAARSVSVKGSAANFNNLTGIALQGTDGIEIKNNQVVDNPSFGIFVDANSDGNRISGNDIEGSASDVSDAGTGNCWKKNQYTTGSVPSCP